MARPAHYHVYHLVSEIYIGLFASMPDREGLDYWASQILFAGWSYPDIANSFFQQPLVRAIYAPGGNRLVGNAFLTALYQNVFKVKEPDPSGFAYWQQELRNHGIDPAAFHLDHPFAGTLVKMMIDGMWDNPAASAVAMQYQKWIDGCIEYYHAQPATIKYSSMAPAQKALFIAEAKKLYANITADSTQIEISQLVKSTKIDTFGNDIELTPADDIVPFGGSDFKFRTSGTADRISGIVSATAAKSTLNGGDAIDGGPGQDTLDVIMETNFTGFNPGAMKNVETIRLINSGTTPVTFDAKQITGVKEYYLDIQKAPIEIIGLSNTADLYLSRQSSGVVKVGFASGIVDGNNDSMRLHLKENGNPTAPLDIKIPNVETLQFMLTGSNYVTLADSNSTTRIEVEGSGTLYLAALPANLPSSFRAFNAKNASGDLKITADPIKLSNTATFTGGSGDNTLIFSGTGAHLSPAMTHFQTIHIGALGNAKLMLDMNYQSNTAQLKTVQAGSAMNNRAELLKLGNTNLQVELQGANSSGQELILSHTGTTTLTVGTPAAAATLTAPSANNIKVIADNTVGPLTMTVAEKMAYAGTVKAASVEHIDLRVLGQLTGAIIDAPAASTVTISDVNNNDQNSVASKATLLVPTATALIVDVDKGSLDLTGSNFAHAAAVTIAGVGNLILPDLGGGPNVRDFNMTSTNGAVLQVGKITAGLDGQVTLDLAGALGLIKLTGLISGKNVTIDGKTATLGMTGGAADQAAAQSTVRIEFGEKLVLHGSAFSANDFTATGISGATALTATFWGGARDDKIKINGGGANATVTRVELNGDLGLGNNTATIDVTTAKDGVRVFANQLKNAHITVIGSNNNDTIHTGAGNDTLSGGKGADVFIFEPQPLTAPPGPNSFDVITDYKAAEGDVIQYRTAGLVIETEVKNKLASLGLTVNNNFLVTGPTDFAAFLFVLHQSQPKQLGGTLLYSDGKDSYLFISDGIPGLNAGDTFIKLLGINATTGLKHSPGAGGSSDIIDIA